MAEMERLKADEKAFKAFSNLQGTTKVALERAYHSVVEFQKEGTNVE
jgi:hypothetical protein